MLTRKCQETTGLLITAEDFNVRLTVAKNASSTRRYVQKSLIEGVWKEYMRDSMGEVLNKGVEYAIECFVAKDGEVKKYSAHVFGNQILDYFWQYIVDADGIRISATQANGKNLSWIIVRE